MNAPQRFRITSDRGWYGENLAVLKPGSVNSLLGAELSANAVSAQISGSHFELEQCLQALRFLR